MTELKVSLDFACHACCRPVRLTVRCQGSMLALTKKVLANVTVPCPNCNALIDLTFDPDGTVHRVAPHAARLPEPSAN